MCWQNMICLLALSLALSEGTAARMNHAGLRMVASSDNGEEYAGHGTTVSAPAHNISNATIQPTPVPYNASNFTIAPTPSHSDASNATIAPTSAYTHSNVTLAPTPVPYNHSNVTVAPTPSHHNASNATFAPTAVPISPAPKKVSIWRIVSKTIGWLVLIALSLLGFGFCMSNRFRIYFFLRGVWYTVLRMDCTVWIMRKLRIGDYSRVDNSLNTVIFENDMGDGLLMREND